MCVPVSSTDHDATDARLGHAEACRLERRVTTRSAIDQTLARFAAQPAAAAGDPEERGAAVWRAMLAASRVQRIAQDRAMANVPEFVP